ncbi:MAG: long-chain-fatty-acid--CoA ligase [Pseudomonadales bacterium]|nr:long-chain-fatty-acid--CoA ligase [Halioglobus sp.]MCP5121241.1 long-chain-fatty-acid--CoA ligase [Pseudomonadales bacterium]MCP5193419.1 long-chain-fatty-acid--CoA ligase [Pseudomonadales bacterium]
MTTGFNIGNSLTTRAYLNPTREALYDVAANQRFTFAQLDTRANQCCAVLQSLGLRRGDRAALMLHNGHEFIESFFGPAKAGIVLMPLNWRLTADELSFILKDGGARVIIFEAEFAPVVAELRARGTAGSGIEHWICVGQDKPDFSLSYEQALACAHQHGPEEQADEDDNLFIMYTSGTTGSPKGVVHTHKTVFWALLTLCNTAEMHLSDKYLVLLPLFHVGALTPMITAVYKGNALVILRNFDPQKAWSLIESEKINTTLAVPAMLGFMLQVPDFQRFDWSSLRAITSGAAPLPVNTINSYLELGIEIHQVYGMTETCGPACLIGPDDARHKIGSTGKSFFHTQVRIADTAGNELPRGEAGEVQVRAPHNMKEYWQRPEATAETIVDGWLHTGDVAVMDAEGFVTIQDRIKDMIISGGENVYPAEVENVLLSHPGIADAAVIGQDSAKWGESPLAVIVRKDESLTEAQVLEHCNGKLARFKQPRAAVFIEQIPRNPSGKVLKRILRQQYPGPARE